jgi:hypothetical protein
MPDENPITFEELSDEHKQRYNEIKAAFEADLIDSFERTHHHGIRWKGFSSEGALDEVDLSTPMEERTRALCQEVNYMVAHSLHRHSESLVNTLERVAVRVVKEIMKHQYSPTGPALGSHRGELPSQSRPPMPYAFAAPEQQNSPAYVICKVGGDPADHQFFSEPPKEEPYGYVCAYIPDGGNPAQSTQRATGGTSAVDADKQALLATYAIGPSHEGTHSAPGVHTVDQISAILRYQFGILPRRRAIGYIKPYPSDYDLIPLPPKYRLPEFTKFNGAEGSSFIVHVSRYLAQLGMISVSDPLRVRFFSQSLTGPAFGWYTSLGPDSIHTWKQLEEQFHIQYHSEAVEAGIADLAQVHQKRGQTVVEYIQHFREVKNRCYSIRISEKEAVELATLGLVKLIKDLVFQLEFNSLAHLVQKMLIYEQRHPELYQDKFKRQVVMVDIEDSEDFEDDREIAVVEWARGAKPVPCKWVKQQGPLKGFDFDMSKVEQIFNLLLKEKQLKFPEGFKIPTTQELQGRSYCKWHNSFTHGTGDCKELQRQIQSAIEQGGLILGQYAMKVDTQSFPDVNMVEGYDRSTRRQLDFTLGINMAGHASHQHRRRQEADSRDRPQKEEKYYITEEQVRHVRNQRPVSSHLLRKYQYQYQQRLQDETKEEEYERHTGKRFKKREDTRDHWHCPFFKYCWDSGMKRLPTLEDCPECNSQKPDTRSASVFQRLGPGEPCREQDKPTHIAGNSEDEEDKYHQPRWCPDGLNRSQKWRVQWLCSLEEAEAQYLETIRKARPDLAEKVHRPQKAEASSSKKV